MGGGAWPFLVGGAICLVNSVNERDLSLLTSYVEVSLHGQLLRGTMAFQATEVCDALRCSGPHARYTDVFNESIALADRPGKSLKFHRDGDRSLQLLVLNEEFLVSASHQLALTTSLPFVHTARRSYRLNGPVKCSDRGDVGGSLPATSREKHKRLSATDISALASMKNVAKCDTWCELQNPVNHRVFERKLRPKPLGRGHVCLGVTHRVAPPTPLPTRVASGGGRGQWPPVPPGAAGPKSSPRRRTSRRVVVVTFLLSRRAVPRRSGDQVTLTRRRTTALRPRPQVRRDYPLSLSISISGGKETYKDSPSNGERTGNSPA
ncbi:hypothetical protein LguiB_036179 [Lonicera macranthoides]